MRNIGSSDPNLAASIASLAMLRARHGDTVGLDDFANWIQKADPNVLGDSVLDALEPFWQFPRHASLRAAAQATFGDTNSSWGNLEWMLDAPGHLRWRKPLASPVLMIPEVRRHVLNELASRAPAGEASYRGGGYFDVKYTNGSTGTQYAPKESQGMEVGTKSPFRRCDLIADQLSAIPGFPRISLTWPEPGRDEAVAGTVELLTASGDRLRVRKRPPNWSSRFDPPLVEFGERTK